MREKMGTGAIELTAVNEKELPLNRFYRWERERAGRLFLTQPFNGGDLREWTWAQAAGEIRRIAGHLRAQNWEPGTHVAILSKNCAWWIMADLAIWMAGHVTVPIYASLRGETVRQILEHSESKACFIGPTDEREAAVAGISSGIHCVRFPNVPDGPGQGWDAIVAATPALEGEPVRPAGDLATIFYTSGTTGEPKGVMQSFIALAFVARTLARRLALSGEHRALSYLPLAHIFERGATEMPAIIYGWHVFFTEGIDTFITDLQRARPTMFVAVPRILVKLHQGVLEKVPKEKLDRLLRVPIVNRAVRRRVLRELGLDAVRFAASGAAPLQPDLLLWYRKLGLNLLEGFGLTEGMITHLPKAGCQRPGYIGTSLDGVETKRAENGEMLLKSPMNMLGYYKDPQATQAAFTPDGFLRTGDIIELEPDGQVKIIGRIKEQFKTSKGKYVTPAPIETKLVAHPDVESCCLMGTGLPSPFAVVVLTAQACRRCEDSAARKALETSLLKTVDEVNATLEHHERVAFIAIVNDPWTIQNGLMTPTLKFRRAALEALYSTQVDGWRTKNQRVIWQEAKTEHAGSAES
jgi:long-chain acyl-CoA synthetase